MSGHAEGNETNILRGNLKETLMYKVQPAKQTAATPGRRQNSDPINAPASEGLKDSFVS